MKPKPIPRDIVVFLGAGFSCDAGLPTMAQFGQFSQEERVKLCEDNKRSPRNTFQLLNEAGRVFQSFQEFCRRAFPDPQQADNMETIFSIAEVMREAQVGAYLPLVSEDPEAPVPGGGPIALDAERIVNQVKLWLWEVYNCFPPLDSRRNRELGKKPRQYEDFFHLLNKGGLGPRTTILTTNYDLTCEYYSWAIKGGKMCAYPLRYDWDYMPVQAGERSPSGGIPDGFVNVWEHEPECPVLCKLHGSVNFFAMDAPANARLGIAYDLVHDGDWVGLSPIGQFRPPYDSTIDKRPQRPAIFAQDAIWNLRQRYGQSLVPEVIPPTYAKLQGQPWLRKMWNQAFLAVQKAHLAVFIGYRLPETDGFMRAMLQGALAMRSGDAPSVYVVNPFGDADGALDRYKRLFPVLKEQPTTPQGERVIKKRFHEAVQDGDLERILNSAVRSG